MGDIARKFELEGTGGRNAASFATDPAAYFGDSWHAMHHMDRDELAALQLDALKQRFADLRHEIPTLDAMAGEQGIDAIEQLNDVVPLLFQHTVYKSYPSSLLLNSKFGPLTKWLSRLTTHDLSGADVDGCDSIDSWLDALDAQTELRVCHSSGTAGTMSFYPRGRLEWERMMRGLRCALFQFSDPENSEDHSDEYFQLIWPLFRSGRSAITRFPEMAMPIIMGSPDNFHPMREGRLSSDGMFLAGRVAAAEARGELDQLEINPALIARRDEFVREQAELRESIPRFIDRMTDELAGQRVWLLATWNVVHGIAEAGLAAGKEAVFAPDSLISTGGGAKGQVVPDDWEETVKRFVGVEKIQHGYAMTELTGLNRMCENERYHLEPWVIPFALDPEDGSVLAGGTGRGAFFDLMAETYWGGTISGDEVTLDYEPCACGRTTAHLARKIERYSAKQGGDDKITCAASDEAHAKALEFLTGRL